MVLGVGSLALTRPFSSAAHLADDRSVSTGGVLVQQAGGQIESAIRWLERQAATGTDELSRMVREHHPEMLLEQARQRLAQRLGVFEYESGQRGEHWSALATPDGSVPGSSDRRPVVLLIHGLDEPGDIWDELAPALHRNGFRVLRFNYANDQDPVRSADQFADALKLDLARAGVEELSIIAHSMGGLISRDVLTRHAVDPEWNGPRVTRLITVGTPNHGSPVAALQPLGEAREAVARLWNARTLSAAEILGMLVDGSGEAAIALAEGSVYLQELNARPLPQELRIVVIAASATADQRQYLDDLASEAASRGIVGEAARAAILSQIDAMTDRIGDGVVPLASTPLEGAAAYHVLSANHRSMLRTVPLLSTEPIPPAIPLILDALSKD